MRLKRPRPNSLIGSLTQKIFSPLLEICFLKSRCAILFLDFDGVLHPEHCHESRRCCCLSILEDALRQVPECQIVITSTWRLEQAYEDLLERFSPDIAAMIERYPQILRSNERPEYAGGVRAGAECHAWLWANDVPHRRWVAVDDRSWLYRPFCKSLFLVDGRTGLLPGHRFTTDSSSSNHTL